MDILFFDAIASSPKDEAFAVSWIAAEIYTGIDDNYVMAHIDDPVNYGIVVSENNMPEKQWVKNNIVPSWQNMKIVKNAKKMRQEFWTTLEHFQPQQIWSDALLPVKGHFMWQVMQENFDEQRSVITPFPVYDLGNFVDHRLDRMMVLREVVAESEGNATGFLDLCGQKLLLKPNNPLISGLASLTLFSYILDKRKITLFV